MPNVTYVKPELTEAKKAYQIIEDCLDGEMAVKKRGDAYLPRPNAADTSEENKKRYEAYICRAVFSNYSRRTLSALVGQIFMREPVLTIPPKLNPISTDASGTGMSLDQSAKRACFQVIGIGRLGIMVDYPKTPNGTTKADLNTGLVRPSIVTYRAQHIINWRTMVRKSKTILQMVVIWENYNASDDMFEEEFKDQYRVLRIGKDGFCLIEVYRETTTGWEVHETSYPTFADGSRLDELPFQFVGSETNDASIDPPPMLDIAVLNIGHYRNSADYEEVCFICGQATPVLTGITFEWNRDVLKDRVEFGSRAAIPLPVGGDAKLLQAEQNSMPFEAMEHKERQMVALGARLVQNQKTQRTATETDAETAAESSIVSTSARNVSLAYTWALKLCAKFVGVPDTDVEYKLSSEYDLTRLTPEELAQFISLYTAELMTFEEVRDLLLKAGLATQTVEEAVTSVKNMRTKLPPIEIETETQINKNTAPKNGE